MYYNIYGIFKNSFFVCLVFVAACRLPLVAGSGGYSSVHRLLLWSVVSRCMGFGSFGMWALLLGFSSCGV